MNIFAFFSLFSFIVCAVLGPFVFFKNPRALLNQLYMLLFFFLGLYAFIEFGYRQAITYEEAWFWRKIDVLWPIPSVLTVYFILVFVEKPSLLKNKWFHIPLTLPAIAFVITDIAGCSVYSGPVKQYWGWSYGPPVNGFASVVVNLWVIGTYVFSFVLAVHYLLTVKKKQKKNQIKLLILGLCFPLVAMISETVLNIFRIGLPPLAPTSFIILNIFVAYSIWKYEMFALTPITAAERIVTTMSDTLLLVSPDGKILTSNKAAQETLGYRENELVGLSIESIFPDKSDIPSWLFASHDEGHWSVERIKYMETSFRAKDKVNIPVSLAGSALYLDNGQMLGFVLIARDITESKKIEEELRHHKENLEELVDKRTQELKKENYEKMLAEAARASLEEQLHQSQKMEAIGRLAGGVAHDFNNLLFVISGYADVFLQSIHENDPSREDAEEIHKAAKKAAGLTKQLLAFSRKQAINPKVMDLTETVSRMQTMLGRIIGEDIDLIFEPARNLDNIMMDPVQIDQILANLFVNARDAMPSGGKLVVRARNIALDESAHERNPEAKPGRYVLLSVTDTGCGMDSDIKNKCFEPFFTTKGRGKGTGLGLATVYGIVKQNRGFIEVKSSPGVGTTFDIYLPQVEAEAQKEEQTDGFVAPKGTETILLVEDEPGVRRLAGQLLRKQGYKVLEATDAREALTIFNKQNQKIDLLFTDIVMPGMSGKQLSEHLLSTKPDLRVLYMSGHNEEIIDQQGAPVSDIPLLQKPFSSDDLSWKVREILDA
jgi:PAS domain S-box-containing protein